jgi:hypothetical protein
LGKLPRRGIVEEGRDIARIGHYDQHTCQSHSMLWTRTSLEVRSMAHTCYLQRLVPQQLQSVRFIETYLQQPQLH